MGKYFDILAFLMGKAAAGGGGDITVESKSFSSNGTYTAPSGKAYSPVTVNVPNSYAAGDEGKVVSNGELVSQTAHEEVNTNGTIDTTLNNSVVVNVPAGTSFTLLAEQDFEVNTVSTTEITVGSIEIPGLSSLINEKKKWLWVLTRDKAGKQNGHYFGNDTFKLGSGMGGQAVYIKSNGTYDYSSYQYGIYPNTNMSQDTVSIRAKYASSFGVMSGTFSVKVYVCDYPSGVESLY